MTDRPHTLLRHAQGKNQEVTHVLEPIQLRQGLRVWYTLHLWHSLSANIVCDSQTLTHTLRQAKKKIVFSTN